MDKEKLRKTPFYDFHKDHNAKIVPFAGYEMPLQYEGILKEALHTRRSLSIFDVSHMGEIEVRGDNALEFLSFITSNDPSKLEYGKVQYSILLTEKGTCVDDLLIYKLKDSFLCVVNAANRFKDFEYMKKMSENFKGVEVIDKSDETFQLAIQGPRSQPFMEEFFDRSFSDVKFYNFIEFKFMDNDLIISRTGYTGEDGFEIYGNIDFAMNFMNLIIKKGSKFNMKPAGLGARDILRLEMGYPLYGNELTEEITPIEAGLTRFVKINKERFLGKEILENQIRNGTEKKLTGLVSEDMKGVPRKGSDVFLKEDKVGFVTSGAYSPFIEKNIALAYINTSFLKNNEEFDILIRKNKVKFKKETLPFVKDTSLKR